MPKQFLTDLHGQQGDSGSLVAAAASNSAAQDLLGIYLGKTACWDTANRLVDYGFALDLEQAAQFFGATGIRGEFI